MPQQGKEVFDTIPLPWTANPVAGALFRPSGNSRIWSATSARRATRSAAPSSASTSGSMRLKRG